MCMYMYAQQRDGLRMTYILDLRFYINKTTGLVSPNATFDRETEAAYTINVEVRHALLHHYCQLVL